MKVEHNILRLEHLLNMFDISRNELLDMINRGLKKKITEEDIFGKGILSNEIKINHLKRIDKIFKKGLHYYLDPKDPKELKESSIFFRKQKFSTPLNIQSRRVVNHFEELKISLSAIAKLSDLVISLGFNTYSVKNDPKKVAKEIREILYPDFKSNPRDFLKSLIYKFAENNIFVFEFIEYWNQTEKTNIDGFFLDPNVIVIKRQQVSFKREIFTLIHELGHFLLKKEEIEQVDFENAVKKNLFETESEIEKWCNDFAYHFLAGNFANTIDNLDPISPNTIREISQKTNLSKTALYTRLLYQKKISQNNYNKIKNDFEVKFKKEQEEKKTQVQKKREKKQRGASPQSIKSPLFIDIIQTAFYQGILNEYEVCKQLNIKPEKLDKYIQ